MTVERFTFRGCEEYEVSADGNWVRASDYDKAVAQRDEELRERLEKLPTVWERGAKYVKREEAHSIFEEPMMPDDHRGKAVEAACESWWDGRGGRLPWANVVNKRRWAGEMREVLQAAEPHLQRMFFERFREAMLSSRSIEKACVAAFVAISPTLRADMKNALQAALDQAQELMEGEDGVGNPGEADAETAFGFEEGDYG